MRTSKPEKRLLCDVQENIDLTVYSIRMALAKVKINDATRAKIEKDLDIIHNLTVESRNLGTKMELGLLDRKSIMEQFGIESLYQEAKKNGNRREREKFYEQRVAPAVITTLAATLLKESESKKKSRKHY